MPTPVSLNVTVLNDRKEFVKGLTKDSFAISDDKGMREITSFSQQDVPISVAMLIDLSGSIDFETNRKRIGSVVDGLSGFVEKSNPVNEYFVIGFNTSAHLFLNGEQNPTSVLGTLQKVASTELKGNTAFYDACLSGLEIVDRGLHPKRVILLISDGQDNVSKHNLNDVRRVLREKNVLIYSLNVSMGLDPTAMELHNNGSRLLEEFASLTGGTMYEPRNATSLAANLKTIASELRQQYSIGFLPPKGRPSGKWHDLKVRVSQASDGSKPNQKVSVRSRKGYYSY